MNKLTERFPGPAANLAPLLAAAGILTAEELKILRALDAKHDELHKVFKDHLEKKAREAFHEQAANLRATPGTQETAKVKLRSELSEKFQLIRQQARRSIYDHNKETVFPFLEPILQRAIASAEKIHAALESQEQKSAQKHGVSFAPSPTLRAVAKAIGIINEQLASPVAEMHALRPSDRLPFETLAASAVQK